MIVLKVSHISKTLSKKLILDDISFELNEGEIVGFVGPNGSGKTTTLRVICNLIYPENGNVEICGYDVVKERRKALEHVAAVIENPGLYPHLTGFEHLKFISLARNKSKEKINDVIVTMGMEEYIHKRTSRYSMGMKQRLGLAMCLLAETKLLILDEPSNGLDPSGVIELRNRLKKLAKQDGKTIFFSSHNLFEIEKICDKIIFIKEGKIIDIQEKLENFDVKYRLKVDNLSLGYRILLDAKINVVLKKDELEILLNKEEVINGVLKQLIQKDIEIIDIVALSDDTENIYNMVYGDVDNYI